MGARYKILIADDGRDFVKVLGRLLESSGYETCAAFEGIRAIEAAVKQKPHLVLLDIMMPTGDGIRVLEALRSQPATKKLPILVLTSSTDPSIEEQMRQKGAQGVLFKPIDNDLLISSIKALLPDSALS